MERRLTARSETLTLLPVNEVPRETRAVVVGCGIVGCSVAYHLTALGWRDTVVLEQGKIAGGTTWHSAGQVGRLRVSRSMTEVNKYSAELYGRLEAETGVATGWKATGSLMVATSADRTTQLRRTVAMGELFGVEAHLVDAAFVAEKWPLMRTHDLKGAAWIPGDGKVNAEIRQLLQDDEAYRLWLSLDDHETDQRPGP